MRVPRPGSSSAICCVDGVSVHSNPRKVGFLHHQTADVGHCEAKKSSRLSPVVYGCRGKNAGPRSGTVGKKQKPTKLYSWNSDRTAIVIVQFFFRWDNLALACVHKYPLVASGALGDQMQGDVPCTLLTHGLSTEHIILCEEMGMLVGLGDVDPGPLAAYIVVTPRGTPCRSTLVSDTKFIYNLV